MPRAVVWGSERMSEKDDERLDGFHSRASELELRAESSSEGVAGGSEAV